MHILEYHWFIQQTITITTETIRQQYMELKEELMGVAS